MNRCLEQLNSMTLTNKTNEKNERKRFQQIEILGAKKK